jgi:hypothetical protein
VPIELHSVTLGQKTLSAWEAKELRFVYLPATVTITGGTAVTPSPVLPGDAAAVTTVKSNNTTLATTGGSARDLFNDDWAFLNGFYWSPPGDEGRFVIKPADAVVIRLPTAPSGAMVVSGAVEFGELV